MKDIKDVPNVLLDGAQINVDPSKLQMLGKQAADLYSNSRTKLSEAVVQVIGDSNLGTEHVRRICEFANQEAFANEWEKGGAARNIVFEGGPANPADVLRDLHDGSKPSIETISDYDYEPTHFSDNNRIDDLLFGKYSQAEKVAEKKMPSVQELRADLLSAKDHFDSKISYLEMSKVAMLDETVNSAFRCIADGESPVEILHAWEKVATDKRTFEDAVSSLLKKVNDNGLGNMEVFREKVAYEVPNDAHPVIKNFKALTKIAKELKVNNAAKSIIMSHLLELKKAQ